MHREERDPPFDGADRRGPERGGSVIEVDGIGELRIDYGPGYRLYFVQRGNTVIVLLCGGDKRRQDRDIKRAIDMAKEV